jgi:poly(3-hydroxyalkanoate) synthetase
MKRPDAPGPLHRRGPRPLLLHLTQGMRHWQDWQNGSPNWSENWQNFPTSSFLGNPELVAGIAAYRRHPYHRSLIDPQVIWEEGESRLLDYGTDAFKGGAPILFIPSLVNRAYILDLMEDRSFLRYLASQGHRPLLLDWGWPAEEERGFTLTDLVAGRMERALAAVGQKVTLAGYCMGGLLALACAQRRPDLVQALALLATPWDFHAPDPAPARRLAEALPALRPMIEFTHSLPVDALQYLFATLDPDQIARKYRGFAALDPASDVAIRFVALEDWLNDGVPLAGPIAVECLEGWYGANKPMNLAWRIAGLPVEPRKLRMPCLVAVPDRDHIVPAEQALPLAAQIEGATLLRPRAGHIGMVAGSRATEQLWQPFSNWLSGLPRPHTASISRLRKL